MEHWNRRIERADQMTEFQERPLDEARTYVLRIISQFKGLSAEIATQVSSGGRCYVVLPGTASLARAQDFESGWVTKGQTCSEWLQSKLDDYASVGRSGVIIVQDLSAVPGDHSRFPPQTDWCIHNDVVYMWTEFGSDRNPQIKVLLREPISFQIAIFIVDDPGIANSLRVGKASIKQIVSNVFEVYVSAYDRDGFALWKR